MKFTRRTFIKSSSILTAGLFLPKNILHAFQSEGGKMQILRNNVGIFTEKGGTIGYLISDNATVVIDSQFPDSAKHFISEVLDQTHRRIEVLINTHHHRDHTSGNFMMKKLTDKIVANENAVALQKKFYGSGDSAQSQVYANITFTDKWSTTIGKEKITAEHLWAAHTGGDSFIHFENDNVVHLGDLVFNGVYPYMDRPAGTNIAKWIEYDDEILKRFDNDTIFIFGHGTNVYGGKKEVEQMRDYLSALLDYVSKNIKSGKSLEQIQSLGPVPGFENLVEVWEGALKMSLTAAYEELSS